MKYIGIDPGITGAVVCIYSHGDPVIVDTPVLKVSRGKKTSTVYDAAQMAARMKGFGPFDHTLASIEQVHAMPGEGAVGAFSFGTGYGIWLGLLAALQVPHQFVTPQAWKKLMLAGGAKEKDAARLKAMQLYPCVADRLTLKKHHGRADALLIAEWARRTDDRNSEA